MNNQSTTTYMMPDAAKLTSRKEAIQDMYQSKEGVPYPLVSDSTLLVNIPTEELAKSYQSLWSLYIKDAATKSTLATFQLNIRLYDLCCRADVLYTAYLKYLNRPPISVTKRPFHAWIVSIVPKDPNETMIGRTHSGKKSILHSFPIDQQKRNRVLNLVTTYGLGLLACEELVCLGTLANMVNSDFTALETALDANKDATSTTFTTASISGSFDSTAAKMLYSDANSTATGKVVPLANGK